jgi:hypothetical protein
MNNLTFTFNTKCWRRHKNETLQSNLLNDDNVTNKPNVQGPCLLGCQVSRYARTKTRWPQKLKTVCSFYMFGISTAATSVSSQKTRILTIKAGETLNLRYQNVYCGLLGYDTVQSGTHFMWNVTDTSCLTNWQLQGGKFMMYQQFNFLLSKPANWSLHSKYPQAD